MNRTVSVILLVLSLALAGAGAPDMAVHFFSVRDADAIYIQLPNGYDVIIDGGWGDHRGGIADHMEKSMISDGVIELLIVTHYDLDHYGGIADLLGSRTPALRVELLVSPGMSAGEERLLAHVLDDQARWLKVNSLVDEGRLGDGGYVLREEDGHTLTILGPTQNWGSKNNTSVIVLLEGPSVSVLFMGDAEKEAEFELLSYHLNQGTDLTADVIKIGHHGSNSSTTATLLDVVRPGIAVISDSGRWTGQLVVDRLLQTGAHVYQTGTHGNVVLEADENAFWVRTSTGLGPFPPVKRVPQTCMACVSCVEAINQAGHAQLQEVLGETLSSRLLNHLRERPVPVLPASLEHIRYRLEEVDMIGEGRSARITKHFCPALWEDE